MPAVPRAVHEACQSWARLNLSGYTRSELQRGLDIVQRHPDAHRPFVSVARTAYTRLTAYLAASPQP